MVPMGSVSSTAVRFRFRRRGALAEDLDTIRLASKALEAHCAADVVAPLLRELD
jgi:hypothetical protein